MALCQRIRDGLIIVNDQITLDLSYNSFKIKSNEKLLLNIDLELQEVTIMLAYLIVSALILSVKKEDLDWKSFHTFL